MASLPAPPRAEKCNPCLRYVLLPMSQDRTCSSENLSLISREFPAFPGFFIDWASSKWHRRMRRRLISRSFLHGANWQSPFADRKDLQNRSTGECRAGNIRVHALIYGFGPSLRASPPGATCRQHPHVIENSVLGIARIVAQNPRLNPRQGRTPLLGTLSRIPAPQKKSRTVKSGPPIGRKDLGKKCKRLTCSVKTSFAPASPFGN